MLIFCRHGGLFLAELQRNKFFSLIPFSKTTFPFLSEFNRFSDVCARVNSNDIGIFFSFFGTLGNL